jgi:hypothetical protein
LLDETTSEGVRISAAGALLAICRGPAHKLGQTQRRELAHWAVTELPLKRNAEQQFIFIEYVHYQYLYDVLWEILWLVA